MDVVVLDFDGTITRRDTTRVLMSALLWARPWRLFSVLGSLFRLAVGGNEEQVQNAKDRCVGRLLSGFSKAQVQLILLKFRQGVLPLMRPELLALIQERAAAGLQILVVSASAEDAVYEALRDFSVVVLGTRFEVRRGIFTGAIEGQGCYGAAKVPRIRAWADTQPTQPHFVEAWSDSLSDLPMMELAEQRMWVCCGLKMALIRELDPQGKMVTLS